MPDHFATKVSEPMRAVPSTGTLKHVRAAALVAALVPLAQVVATPVTVLACGASGEPPCSVPDGGSTLAMAATAAAFMAVQLRKKK